MELGLFRSLKESNLNWIAHNFRFLRDSESLLHTMYYVSNPRVEMKEKKVRPCIIENLTFEKKRPFYIMNYQMRK